jgi:hypothetical protein
MKRSHPKDVSTKDLPFQVKSLVVPIIVMWLTMLNIVLQRHFQPNL